MWSKYKCFLLPYIKTLATNVRNLQKSKIDIALDITTRQANTEASQSMKIYDLLANLELEANSGDFLDNDQIAIFNTLKKSISFVLQ